MEALRRAPHFGGQSGSTRQQRQEFVRLLKEGALAAGFSTELWTAPRIAQLIETKFSVKLVPTSVWRLLGRLGWSVQRPTGQARERDERAVRAWRAKRWPDSKNRCATRPSNRLHRRVGSVRKTLSRKNLGSERSDARAAIQLQLETTLGDRGPELLALLFPLVQRLDQESANSRVPRSLAGNDRQEAAHHLGSSAGPSLEAGEGACRGPAWANRDRLPAGLRTRQNPVECSWRCLKHHAMPNYCARDLGDVAHRARSNLRSMQRRPTLVTAFWKQVDLF